MENFFEDCENCFFRTNICRGVSKKLFKNLFYKTDNKVFEKGDVIFKQNIKTDYLLYLRTGKVKFCYEEKEKNIIITIDKAPTLLGLVNILNDDINTFSIVAIEHCETCVIDIKKFKTITLRDRQMLFNIMSFSTIMFKKSIYNFISLAHKNSTGRIADILLYLAEYIYESNSFVLQLSRQELAEFAGCSKEQVIHTLRDFYASKIIDISAKKIDIVDLEKLRKISKYG